MVKANRSSLYSTTINDWNTLPSDIIYFIFFIIFFKINLNTSQENKKPEGCPSQSSYILSRWQIESDDDEH